MQRLCGAAAFALIVLWAIRGVAEQQPQYSVWEDFEAIARQSSIPDLLGAVDRIERADQGRYIVRAGTCFVEIVVRREASRDSEGRPIPGPSRVADVKIGARRCN